MIGEIADYYGIEFILLDISGKTIIDWHFKYIYIYSFRWS